MEIQSIGEKVAPVCPLLLQEEAIVSATPGLLQFHSEVSLMTYFFIYSYPASFHKRLDVIYRKYAVH
jgi:hypothetical protein